MKIEVTYQVNFYVSITKTFSDWLAFADWLKQRSEAGLKTTIINWRYVS